MSDEKRDPVQIVGELLPGDFVAGIDTHVYYSRRHRAELILQALRAAGLLRDEAEIAARDPGDGAEDFEEGQTEGCGAMSDNVDTSAEAVTTRAKRHWNGGDYETAALLRALLRERDEARAALGQVIMNEQARHAALYVRPDIAAILRGEAVAVPATAWQHVKRGTTYDVIGNAEVQATSPVREGDVVVVYRGKDGKFWARPEPEFVDGRFVPAASPYAPKESGNE